MRAEQVKAGAVMSTAAGQAYKVQAVAGGAVVATDKVFGVTLEQAGGVFVALSEQTVFNVDALVVTGFRVAPVALSGDGGDTPFDPAVLQRKVAVLSAGEHSFSAADNRNVFRVSADGTEVFTPLLAAPPSGSSYEVVFEFTPLTETVNFDFQDWQFVDQAPKPTAWEVGKTYCFTVLYMDGITAPLVALSYTRNAQS